MSPDWSAKEEPVPYAKLDNPQTLNLYGYMQNNPLGGVDQDGHCDSNGQNCSIWDHVAGAVGGALNVVPGTLNLGIKAFNAVSGHFGGPQADELQMIQADTHASGTGMTTGAVASFAIPGFGEERASLGTLREVGAVTTKIDNILAKGLSADTISAAGRELSGGMGVFKPGNTGALYDHPREVEEAIAGAQGQITNAERLLNNSKLGTATRNLLNTAVSKAQEAIAAGQKVLNQPDLRQP